MLRSLSRRLNDINFRDKLLLGFLVFMVLPMLILGVTAIGEFRKAALEVALTQGEQGVSRLQEWTQGRLGAGTGLEGADLDQLVPAEGFELSVVDSQSRLLASSKGDHIGPDPALRALLQNPLKDRVELTTTSGSSWILVRELETHGPLGRLKVICEVNTEIVLAPAARVTGAALLVLGLGTALALGFLWVISTLFSRRLDLLGRQLPRIAAGDLEASVSVEGRDEVGRLAEGVNRMLAQLRELMGKVTDSQQNAHQLQVAQGEIRLKMLASQIQPHFLFNVLESIRMKAHLKGEREIASTVKLLGKLMRRNLEASGAPMPLGHELENVRCYLEIEKFRLEEKLEYQLIAGPGTESVLVLPLIVEPLVENAVIHGLERSFGGGRVTVTTWLQGIHLHVQVDDTGLGMSAEKQLHLLEPDEGHHVGLTNIHQRLRLTYGPDYGLHIRSLTGSGTTVSFQIPLRKA